MTTNSIFLSPNYICPLKFNHETNFEGIKMSLLGSSPSLLANYSRVEAMNCNPSFIREQFDVTCHCSRIKLDASLATAFGRECMDVFVFDDWLTYSTCFQLSFQFSMIEIAWTEPTILRNLAVRSNRWGTGDSMVSKGEIWIFDWHCIARPSSQNSFIQLSYSFLCGYDF